MAPATLLIKAYQGRYDQPRTPGEPWAGAARGPIVKVRMKAHREQGYPVDINGFVRQCAWCRRIADAEGQYRLLAQTLVQGASHGCCEACAIRFLSRTRTSRLAA